MAFDQVIGKIKVTKIQDCWMFKQQSPQHTFARLLEVKQGHPMTQKNLRSNQNQSVLITGLKCLDRVNALSPRTWSAEP